MKTRCLWRKSYSDYFDVLTGTKQGGVLSPRIFTVYMDDLVSRLKKRGIGCHVVKIFVACLLYADDMCLLAPSKGALQELLGICKEYCNEFCLSFNVKKSKILRFVNMKGKSVDPLVLNHESIEFVSQWKYLGTTIVAGNHLTFSSRSEMSCFYRSVNSLMSSIRKPNELVLMNLLYANCVPGLTYASEVKDVPNREIQEMNVALNDAIRRIFSYNR